MLGGLIRGTRWRAAIGLLAIVVIVALAVGWVRRTSGHSDPGGASADVKTDRDETFRS